MENDNNWMHRHENDAPREYEQHPTGARFTPEPEVSNDEYIASKPEKLEAVQNDLENDYPDYRSNTLHANGRNDIAFSDDNPVMGSRNSFDSFNDTDPNRYNNNAGLGIPSQEERKSSFNDEAENEFIAGDYLNDDFESTEFDDSPNDDDNYPKHPEF